MEADTGSNMRLTSRELSTMIVLSALGGAVSVPVGYAGSLFSSIPMLPFGSSQALSGIHVLWLMMAGLLVRRFGAGTLTGLLKGLVELVLFSFHRLIVLPISLAEGAAIDLALLVIGRKGKVRLSLVGGLSSSSNVLVLWATVLQSMNPLIIVYMYMVSFLSGAVLSGLLVPRALKILEVSVKQHDTRISDASSLI